LGNGVSRIACSVFDVFLGVLTGLIWFLLAFFQTITQFLVAIGIGAGIAAFINGVIGFLGLLAVVLFGICLFRRIWGCCFSRDC
jgi:hypothetical protein